MWRGRNNFHYSARSGRCQRESPLSWRRLRRALEHGSGFPPSPSWTQATLKLSGMPRLAILFKILLAICTSTRCPSRIRLHILRPMIVLYRYMVLIRPCPAPLRPATQDAQNSAR
jgi:hypothetical protein